MEFKVYKELDQDRKNSIIINATLAVTFLTASMYNAIYTTDKVNVLTLGALLSNPIFYSISTALLGCYFAQKTKECIENKPYMLKK
jgi:hypothetical protein